MNTRTGKQRAVGIVRVSETNGREGESFVSPIEQRERIETACERERLTLAECFEEPNVSGGSPLARRPGLLRAVEMIEGGEADVIVVAYFDRLVRSLTVQAEVTERVERAGGSILAVDIGEVRADTAAHWLSGTMLGAVAEYHRRTTKERTATARKRATERGVPAFPYLPPGYRRVRKEAGEVVGIEPDQITAPAVVEAFKLRAEGAAIRAVRDYLREHGIERSYHGVQTLLASRVVLGELRHGETVNPNACEPIVDRETWERVQRASSPRGRRAKNDHLLARLRILRCGSCGAALTVGTSKGFTFYRCPGVQTDCPKHVSISAAVAEREVVNAVRSALADYNGTADAADELREAASTVEACEDALSAAVEAFDGLDDVAAAREKIQSLRERREEAGERLARLRAASGPILSLSASADWDSLTRDEQRTLIRATLDTAIVGPAIPGGDPAERLTIVRPIEAAA